MRRAPLGYSRAIVAIALLWGAVAAVGNTVLLGCTAFCAANGDQVLVGNNEDWNNPRTKLWFVPAKPGSYGRMYVGFDDLWPQGGMNERGLWFDGFAAPPVKADGPTDLPRFNGNLIDKAMAECGSVEEVVRLFKQYDRAFLAEAILMFADASGDAVSIERNAMVRKTRSHFVQTNFHQSLSSTKEQDGRFATASAMLDRAGTDISTDLFRRILAATHQKGRFPTLYSNIYELRSRTMYLYHFHDFEHVVSFRLDDELKKGEHVLDVPALFPRNTAAESFAAAQKNESRVPGGAIAATLIALPIAFVAAAVFGWMRGGRTVRLGLAVLAATTIVAVAMTAATLRMHRRASTDWMEFSIGPASGKSAFVGPNMIRSNGISLKAAVATAYDVPAIRVIAPPWLAETRYAINAVVSLQDADSFADLLRQELENRLHLETHLAVRPFDVFVLTATDASRLEPSPGHNPRIWIGEQSVQLQEVSMERFAAALQSILGKPVVDETGITGSYNLELGWEEDRVKSLTAVLRDRFGLQLSPDTRDMKALIVDGVRRDAALVLLAQAGHVTKAAPPQLRERIAALLTIH